MVGVGRERAFVYKDFEDETFDLFALTCFHFHQVAEKYLKAYLLSKKKSFRKIHNLVELVKNCAIVDNDFNDLLKEAATLTPYYTKTRYPITWPVYVSRKQAEVAREAAEKVADFVNKSMKISGF